MNVLEEIVENKRAEIVELRRTTPLEALAGACRRLQHARRPFKALFEGRSDVLIAEIKPKSPSAGVLIEKDPLDIANMYGRSAADVVSVLTDNKYFGGTLDLLKQVRARVPQAVLRKDFIIDEYQVYESALAGADALLLIAAILTLEELKRFITLGESLNLDALVEVHGEEEVETAVATGASVIGINNRDLATLKTDLNVTQRLSPLIPSGIPFISESGFETTADIGRIRRLGARGLLVGTSILQSVDPVEKIAELKRALSN